MTTYIALLRGINVGGHRIIKMADLGRMFEAMGLQRVQTYIQSGNVLFQSDEAEEVLRRRIEHELEVTFGFAVTTVVRTLTEFERIIEHCPFRAETLAAGESLYVSFLAEAPSQTALDRMLGLKSDLDAYVIAGREVYMLLRQSVRTSPLMSSRFEKTLGVPATSRNWQTTVKLAQLGRGLEG